VLLSLEHVARTHYIGPYEKATLVDVSLSLAPGDFVGIWGGHRAGKSTLLRISAGLDVPDEGVVRFAGRDLGSFAQSELDELRLTDIGLAFRDGPQSPEFTLAQWVGLPLLRCGGTMKIRGQVREALRRVDILECQDAKWSNLSEAEQVLASVAHAIVRRPRLLLADDPTPKHDELQDREIVQLLRAVAADDGMAVLMTTRSMSALADVHEAFALSDGRLARVRAQGSVVPFPGAEPAI
jgi:ABC-type lipoprotein export system ATPase subunit